MFCVGLLAFVFSFALNSSAIAVASEVNGHAQILAGVGSTSSHTLLATKETPRSLFNKRNKPIMEGYFSAVIPEAQNAKNIVYLFGGPDILYPQIIFPRFEKLLLVGLEPAGKLANPATLSFSTLNAKIADISNAYRNSLFNSYFITSNMSRELADYGTTTIISTGLVALGFEIEAIDEIKLDSDGQVYAEHRLLDSEAPGVRIRFLRPDGTRGEVYYFRFNLSDSNMKAKPHLTEFVQKTGFDTAFYKAAMYAPHSNGFKVLNNLVLEQTSLVVQADDGIPLHVIEAQANLWNIRLHGVYTKPHSMFGVSIQARLRALFGQQICKANDLNAQALWARVWSNQACNEDYVNQFQASSWRGFIPFRFGYAAVSGPGVVPWAEKTKLGTLMILCKADSGRCQ